MKQKTLTEKLRENPYMMGTFVLGLACILLVFNGFYKADKEINDLTSPETLCSKIRGTPSWANWRGDIIKSGYYDLRNQSPNEVVDILIEEKTYFIYNSECGWCKRQIEEFGQTNWDKYVESGFTIDCAKA